MSHKFMPERTNGGAYFCDCVCGWSGGVYVDRASAKAAHEVHRAGGESTGNLKPVLLVGDRPRGQNDSR